LLALHQIPLQPDQLFPKCLADPSALVAQKRRKKKVAKPHAAQHAQENNNEKTVKMTTLYDKIPITAQARPNIMAPVVRPTQQEKNANFTKLQAMHDKIPKTGGADDCCHATCPACDGI